MKLGKWLVLRGVSASALARKADVSIPSVSQIAKGLRCPKLDMARKLSAATGFEVSAAEIMGLEPRDLVPQPPKTGTDG